MHSRDTFTETGVQYMRGLLYNFEAPLRARIKIFWASKVILVSNVRGPQCLWPSSGSAKYMQTFEYAPRRPLVQLGAGPPSVRVGGLLEQIECSSVPIKSHSPIGGPSVEHFGGP